jgi:hypothetical protein
MADVNSQVALGINAPDPQGSLNTLSKIMGLGQQGLAIRGQQSQNQSLAAKATIDKQTAQENQALAGLMSDPIKSGIVDQDGNPTKDAQTIIMRAAPTTGSAHTSALLDAATKKVGFNSAVNSLRTSERQEISSAIAGAGAGAQQPSDVTDAIDSLVASKKGTPEEANYQTIGGTFKEAINHLASKTSGNNPPPAGQEPWRQGALNIGRSILPAADTVGSGGIGAPQQATVDTGGAIQPGTTAPALQGGGFRPAGAPIQKTTPPTVTTNATGQLVRVAPGGTGASVVPTQAAPGAPVGQPPENANPTTAQAVGQRGQAEAVSQRVGQVQAQAANTVQAQDALSRAKAILESGQSPETGTGFENKKAIANFLSSAGFDTSSADSMNTLAKNLARYEASRATASGLGGTDAARELAHNGSPNTQLDNKALLGIVRQSLASEQVLSHYANVQSKTNDPQKQLQNEAAFRAIPHPIETTEYMMSRNKGEAEEYLHRHGLNHEDIAKSAAALKQFGEQ